jgi:APA family basic amino acid/polyamine antiporter
MSSNKIGFWAVLAIVIGSQIGSGVFMLPATLAPFGIYSIGGWIVSGIGAISLSMVFANLCAQYPKTGGPHVYINAVFGKTIAFFTGWTYWVVSWVSTTTVIIAATGYIAALFDISDEGIYLLIELSLLFAVCFINLFGVCIAGRAESILTALKFLPLFVIPACAMFFYDSSNLAPQNYIEGNADFSSLAQAALITLWGFIGLECATAPAGSVVRPEVTIPKALIIGTIIVALVYVFNSVAIMGLMPAEMLNVSRAPYVDAAKVIFGGNWHMVISGVAAIVCVGTLNAWVLTSGQIALGLSEDGMMPKIFSKKSHRGAPYVGVIVSCLGIVPVLLMSATKSIASAVSIVIEFSVVSFLFIYLLCSVANIFVIWRNKSISFHYLSSFIACLFCVWVISQSDLENIMISTFFTLTGIPVYIFWYKRQN